jgi:uncharacterized protein (TIGR02611 family)
MYEYRDQHAQRTTEGDNTQRDQRPQEQGLLSSGLKQARRLIVLVVGSTVLLAGICMLILPGPGLIVIPLGLAILAIEFAWARRLLNKFKEKGKEVRNSFGGKK